ncbi:uncharacterized protein LOC144373527 isoform X4 [Ictidomys tridecemlineatus]
MPSQNTEGGSEEEGPTGPLFSPCLSWVCADLRAVRNSCPWVEWPEDILMKVATCRIEEETGEDKNWALQDLAADDWEDPRATQMAVGHTRTGCRESFSFVAATIEEAPCPMDPARLLLCGSCEDPPGALPPAPPQPGGLLPKNQPLPCWPDLLSSEHPQGPSYTASSFPQSKWVMLSVGSCFSLLGDLSALRLPIRPWSLKVSMIWTHGPIALRWSLEVGRRRATGSSCCSWTHQGPGRLCYQSSSAPSFSDFSCCHAHPAVPTLPCPPLEPRRLWRVPEQKYYREEIKCSRTFPLVMKFSACGIFWGAQSPTTWLSWCWLTGHQPQIIGKIIRNLASGAGATGSSVS